MARKSKYREVGLQILRYFVILLCIGGFLYQTMEFMFLYWTYPTVVDIQQSSPSFLEAPAISICNPIGYNLTSLCRDFDVSPCLPPALRRYAANQVCERFPMNCWNGSLPKDYSVIRFNKFSEAIELQPEDHVKLRKPLEEYLNCTIEYAGKESPCNMKYVMGSFYSREELHQYCYTLYSLWGKPGQKPTQFPKGAIMKLSFFLNASNRHDTDPSDDKYRPLYNLPSSPAVQVALHSPYHLPSPYIEGKNFLVGRDYEIRLTMNEKHLLPAPYQTNCTNYTKEWERRGGKAPINQMDVVNECRMNKYYENLGCVPRDVDYPHEYPICRMCPEEKCNYSMEVKSALEVCQNLGAQYNQPCDSISYSISMEQRVISFLEEVQMPFVTKMKSKEGVRWRKPHHDCDVHKFWNIECSTINIDILFDRFEITSLTYNPKFESLELFSVIGGYVGMWLGISLVTVYDFIGSTIVFIRKYSIKWAHSKAQESKVRSFPPYEKRHGENFRSARYRDFMA